VSLVIRAVVGFKNTQQEKRVPLTGCREREKEKPNPRK